MAPFLPIRAISRSQAVRIGKQTVKTGTTTYVDLASQTETNGIKAGSTLPFSPFKELQNHLAIGAIISVGGLTFTNSDWAVAPYTTGVTTTDVEEKAKEFEIKTSAGVITQRSTGASVEVEALAATKKLSAVGGKERIDIVTADESAKAAAKYIAGTAAPVGTAVRPPTTEEAKLAEYATKLSKAEITAKEYAEKVAALAKELVVAEIVFTESATVITVRNINRA